MRKIYLSVFISISTVIASGQNITLTTNPIAISGDPSLVEEAVTYIHNNGPESQAMTWLRVTNTIPAEWTSSVCDPNLCWSPVADSPGYTFTLLPGDSGIVYIKFDARNGGSPISGCGEVEVNFYSTTDSANYNVAGVFQAQLGDVECGFTLAFYSPAIENSFLVYPNPAVNDFNAIASYASHIKTLAVINLVGKTMKTFQWETTSGKMNIAINDLAEGIYFVQFIDENEKVVSTKKLAVSR